MRIPVQELMDRYKNNVYAVTFTSRVQTLNSM